MDQLIAYFQRMGMATKDAVMLAQKLLHDQVVGHAGGNFVKAIADPIKESVGGAKKNIEEIYGPEKQKRDLINLYEELGDPPIKPGPPILGSLPPLQDPVDLPRRPGKLTINRDFTGN